MGEVLQLETTLMNSFLDSDSWVYVKIDQERYVRKRANDLQEGDLVVVRNDSINKTLEEIEPALEKSVRYSAAKAGVERTNEHGETTTLLRSLLLEGLASEDPDLEAKIMQRDGQDFTQEEYRQFREELTQYNLSVEDQTVMNWLRGKTHAPLDPENLRKLAEVQPRLEQLADSYGGENGFYADFMVWSETRRVVRQYIAQRTGAHAGQKKTGKSVATGRQYGEEIGLVVSHFMDEVDEQTSAARILKINRPGRDKKGKQRKVQVDHEKIGKGVVLDELGVPLVDMQQIVDDEYVLLNTFVDGIAQAAMAFADRKTGEPGSGINYLGIFELVYNGVLTSLIQNDQDFEMFYEHSKRKYSDLMDVAQEGLNEILSKINGGVPLTLRSRGHTVAHLVDHINRYRSALPKTLLDSRETLYSIGLLDSPNDTTPAKEKARKKAKLERKYASQRAYLERGYGIGEQKKFFLLHHYQSNGGSAREVSVDEFGLEATKEYLKAYKARYEAQGIHFYTRQEASGILSRLGIPEAIHFLVKDTFLK